MLINVAVRVYNMIRYCKMNYSNCSGAIDSSLKPLAADDVIVFLHIFNFYIPFISEATKMPQIAVLNYFMIKVVIF